MSRKLGLLGMFLLLSLTVSTPAWAQVQTGSIFVKATDEQGAAVPGATITLTSPVLPQAVTGVTDTTGAYAFPVARRRHLHRQDRAPRIPDHHA